MSARGREGSRDKRDIRSIVSSILVIRGSEVDKGRVRFGRILAA